MKEIQGKSTLVRVSEGSSYRVSTLHNMLRLNFMTSNPEIKYFGRFSTVYFFFL